jgi:hypothetical protein
MLKRVGLVTLVCILGLLMVACETLKISDIIADPGRFNGKEVTVAGKVTSLSVGALNKGLYEIDDGTGKLVVVSETHGAPAQGAKVGVKGRIVPTFTFLGKNYVTVLRESERKLVKSSD